MAEKERVRVDGAAFEALRPGEQQALLKGMTATGQVLMRREARVVRLRQALAELEARLPEAPKHLKPALEARRAEYLESLANLEDYHEEAPPTGNPAGVDIGMPLGVVARPAAGATEG